jgi:hypothetical protein
VILKLFSKAGWDLFKTAILDDAVSDNSKRIFALQEEYIKTIDPVIRFLQGKIQHSKSAKKIICLKLRFSQLEELDWAFGTMGTQDKAKHLATLYLEDISDFIVECVDANFGFSRYAERLGRSANSLTNVWGVATRTNVYR